MEFSQQWCWRLLCVGMWSCVGWKLTTIVSEEFDASILRACFLMVMVAAVIWYMDIHLPNYICRITEASSIVSHHRKYLKFQGGCAHVFILKWHFDTFYISCWIYVTLIINLICSSHTRNKGVVCDHKKYVVDWETFLFLLMQCVLHSVVWFTLIISKCVKNARNVFVGTF
jgi:hypothetical protein